MVLLRRSASVACCVYVHTSLRLSLAAVPLVETNVECPAFEAQESSTWKFNLIYAYSVSRVQNQGQAGMGLAAVHLSRLPVLAPKALLPLASLCRYNALRSSPRNLPPSPCLLAVYVPGALDLSIGAAGLGC